MIKLVQKYQSTLKKAVTFKGIGVHSGCLSVVKVCPADVGCGIVFKRFAVDGTEQIFQAHASQTGRLNYQQRLDMEGSELKQLSI